MNHLESVRQAVREKPAGEYCASDLIRCRVQTEPCDQKIFLGGTWRFCVRRFT